jgi:hypothetical protein
MRGIRAVWLGQQSVRSQGIGMKSKLVTLLLGNSGVKFQETGEKSRLVTHLLEEFNVKQHQTELRNRRELGQRERKTKKESC